MSRILVTGASGFIGRHALPLLVAHGHDVHAVARGRSRHADGGPVTWHQLDLLDEPAAAAVVSEIEPTRLLHLAWDVEPGRFWTSVENVRWVEASLALLRGFLAAGGERAVLAGTCAEYDWAAASAGVLRERETPIAPATLYGVCKHATHLVAAKLAEQSRAKLAWGRIFYLYGPHEAEGRLVPAIASSLLAGGPTPTTDGVQRRDFMHVADVAAAFVALLESDVVGPVNIASGVAVEVRDIVRMIGAATGGESLLRWGEIARPLHDPEVICGDVERLRNEVGFSPEIDLQSGLEATVSWWRERLAERAGG